MIVLSVYHLLTHEYGADIQVAEGFLAEELVAHNPSPASSVLEYSKHDTIGFTWLIEQKRPVTITKFSRTLDHSMLRKDLQSLTISAFAHYVYLRSKGNRVLADIQGEYLPNYLRNI